MMTDGKRVGCPPSLGFGYPFDPPDVQSLTVTPGGNAIVSSRKRCVEHVRRRLDKDLVALVFELGLVALDHLSIRADVDP